MITYSINTQRVLPGLAAYVWLHVAATWELGVLPGFAPSLQTLMQKQLVGD